MYHALRLLDRLKWRIPCVTILDAPKVRERRGEFTCSFVKYIGWEAVEMFLKPLVNRFERKSGASMQTRIGGESVNIGSQMPAESKKMVF